MKNKSKNFHTAGGKQTRRGKTFAVLTVFVMHVELITTLILTAQCLNTVFQKRKTK